MGTATVTPITEISNSEQTQWTHSLKARLTLRARSVLAWILGSGWETTVILLLVLQTAFLAASAARHTPTVDEPVHLSAGLRFWETGHFDLNRGNPPLVDCLAAIPARLARAKTDWHQFPSSFLCGQDFMRANGPHGIDYIIWGRWMLLPVGAVGGWICALWARQLYGRCAGILAVVMWCACPLMLANTELITGDVSSSVAGLATMYAGWLWMRQPTWRNTFVLGLTLGVAQLTKFVCVVLYPSLFYSWLFWRVVRSLGPTRDTMLAQRQSPRVRSSWSREFLQGSIAVAVSIVTINTGYLFDNTLQPLSQHGIAKYLLPEIQKTETAAPDSSPGTRSEEPIWAHIPVPLPVNYLGGANEISQLFEQLHPTYILGKWVQGGVWYYYLVGFFWKLPLGMIGLIGVSLISTFISPHLRRKWLEELALIIPCVIFLVFVSCVTTVQYLRYGLPALPFLIVYLSRSGYWILKGSFAVSSGVMALAGWAVIATVSIYPHQGSYFNELVGGPEHGADYMIESSIDWGQDLYFLKAWLEQHPEAQPFYLAYFGSCDPRDAGISFQLPSLNSEETGGPAQPPPGYYAISKSLLHGFEWPVAPDGNGNSVYVRGRLLEYLKSYPLVGRAGHSILIFHVSLERSNELKREPPTAENSKPN